MEEYFYFKYFKILKEEHIQLLFLIVMRANQFHVYILHIPQLENKSLKINKLNNLIT